MVYSYWKNRLKNKYSSYVFYIKIYLNYYLLYIIYSNALYVYKKGIKRFI